MFHFSGHGFTPDVPTQIRESTQIDQRTHTTYEDDYDPPKKSKKSRVEEEVQDNKSREEEVKDNTHVQKVSRRTSARILKGKQNILDSTHDLKQKRKRGAILVEDEAVLKDQIPLNKKKKIVAKVKPQEAVPDEKDHVGDDSGQEDDDDFLDDIMPMTKKCNMDIVFKELEKDPKFQGVGEWLKGIEDDAMLSTVEPVVQANVPGFVSTEAVGKLGAGSKLPEFVPPQSMGNLRAGTRLPGFVRPESMGNVGAGAKLPGFGSTFRLSSSSPGIVKERSPVYSQIQKMLRTRTSETETPTPHGSLPLDLETTHQEQKQEEVRVDEVLVLDIGSKREESIEECLVQRDVSRSSDGPLEIEEFEKYLTGDNENEQKNNNDGEDDISNLEGKNSDTEGVENSNSVQKSGAEDDIVHAEVEVENAAIRNSEEERVENSNSVQKSGPEDDIVNAKVEIENAAIRNSDQELVENSNSVQKSGPEDDIVNAEVEIENAAIRNSDQERVENSNSVQKSGNEHDIWKAEVDVRNTEGRNSGDPERVENSNSESDEEDANPTTKEENPTTEEENTEVEETENEDSEYDEEDANPTTKEENPTTEEENAEVEETENEDSEAIYSSEEQGMAIVENLDDEDLEEDSQSDSSSSEEDLAENNSGNPEDVSKPDQPENREQLNIADFEKSGEQEDIVAEKINEPGGRFVNYFSASHRIPKALDVMRAKGNVIPLSEICRMYLGINRDTVAVYMSSCKMKCCYKVFRSRKFQNLVLRSTSSLNVDTLDKKLQDVTTSVLSGNTHNSAGKSSDTEGENYLLLPSYFLSRAKEQAHIKCEIIILAQIVLIFFSFKLKKPESLKAMVPSTKERTVVPVSKRKVNITPETKVSGKESGDTRRQRNETGWNTRIN